MQIFRENSMITKSYTEKDIRVLTDREHVRLRTNLYLGNTEPITYMVPMFTNGTLKIVPQTFIPAVYKAVGEILDNSLDEFAHIKNQDKKELIIEATPQQGIYKISDNGRGVPIGKHTSGPYTPQVVFGQLRSGRNFDEGKENIIGVNGVGSSALNYCSCEFRVTINRDNKKYMQVFSDGAAKISEPLITKSKSDDTGTTIEFQLDGTVFKDVSIPDDLMRNRAIEIAFNRPDIVVKYNGEKFRYEKGFDEIVKDLGYPFYKFETKNMQFYVMFTDNISADDQMFTWVNNSFLFDGGLCNTQFLNAFNSAVISHLTPAAKKMKCEINANDVRAGLVVFGFLKIANPTYDSQAKTRLTGPQMRGDITELISEDWTGFSRKNKDWLETVLQRANVRYHKNADADATKEHEKKKRKKIEGLLDATESNRKKCELYIMEGDSASGKLVEVREPYMGSYPLGGKVNNTYGSTVGQVLQMGKLTDLLAAIGLTPGRRADRSDLRFGRVIIATDADYDGSDIFATLTCLFFHFWPELFNPKEKPYFYRLIAPNVVVSKGKQRIHFSNRNDFDAAKSKYKGWNVDYMKGLGSMLEEDWEMIVSGQTTDVLIPIQDIDGKMDEILNLLFGPNAELRKLWLMGKE